MLVRLDAGAVQVGATPIDIRANGARVYRGRACFGDVVHEYGPSDPGGARLEFVPADVALAPEVLREMVGAPFTVIHPEEMLHAAAEDDIREHCEGSVLRAEADWKSDPPAMVVDVLVLTASAQQAIESGRIRELSLGYECEDEKRPGVHRGQKYDVVQRRRKVNHLSAVHVARSRTADGRGARLDSAAAPRAGQRARGVVLPPSTAHIARMDGIATAPAGHPASGAPVHRYGPGVTSWRGWSEPEDRSWVAFWPRDPAARGLLFTRRQPTGAVLGAPEALPPRPYAHGDTTMEDDLTIPADPIRLDAEGEPEMALAMFSPEAVEILKTLPEEDMMKLKELVLVKQGEDAEQAVLEAGGAAPVAEVDVEDASVPSGSQALTMDAVQKMIADAIEASKKKMDSEPVRAVKAIPAKVEPKPETRVDADEVARKAAAIVRADQAFIARVTRAGHRCDSIKDARTTALALIKAHAPASAPVAERAIQAGRMDDFAALFDAAVEARADGHLADQFSLVEGAQGRIAADRLGTPSFPNVTAPARALTSD